MGLIIQYDHLRNYILFDFSSLTFLNSISIFCVFEYPSKFHIVLKGLLFLRVFLRVRSFVRYGFSSLLSV